MGKLAFGGRIVRGINDKYIVRLENVHVVYYGETRPAIYDISLKVRYGEFILITGPNGAGKTTLLDTIIGLLKPRKGTIRVLGKNIPEQVFEVRKFISYVPQDFIKKPNEPFLVKDVVALALASFKSTLDDFTEEDWTRVYEVLRLLGIEELAYKPIGKLSGGQQQKVMIARALVRRPKLLLLDEPFSNLDRESRVFMAELFTKLNKDGTTIIMVSHDVSVIPKACNRIIEMKNGKIVNEVILH